MKMSTSLQLFVGTTQLVPRFVLSACVPRGVGVSSPLSSMSQCEVTSEVVEAVASR